MRARWLVVLLTAAALVVTPLAVRLRPAASSNLAPAQLVQRMQASGALGWSGSAETSGALQVPESDSFATLSQLLSETSQLRVWWRSSDDWRVDRIRSTGETDLFRQRGFSIRWVFEGQTATVSPVSEIRLPDASDLIPPTLARSLLQGARDDELTPLPSRRVAGRDAAGVRLTPREADGTVGHVDAWADIESGLPLRVEVSGLNDARPLLTTTLVDLELGSPAAETTDFTPTEGTTVNYEESVDVAAAANALARFDLPTTLGGLSTRSDRDPGAVGIYGRGPTTLLVLPLRGRVAWQLREQLQGSADARETASGTLAPVGLLNLLLTPTTQLGDDGRSAFLLVGTVSTDTLERAATALAGQS
jgi:hypothetical protein